MRKKDEPILSPYVSGFSSRKPRKKPMTRTFIAKAKNSSLTFSSGLYERLFRDHLGMNEGKDFRITRAKAGGSDKLRGYYWTSVVTTARTAVPEWVDLNIYQVHECLKKMFSWFETWNPETKRMERFASTVMSSDSTSEEGMEFIGKVATFLIKNYNVGLPNPESYKHGRDSAPLLDEDVKNKIH